MAWGWVAFAAFLYMIGMATRPIRNYAYQFFYVSHFIALWLLWLTLDPTRIPLVHHRRLPRHSPTSTARLDLGWICSALAGPYSPDIPNHPLSWYSQTSPRWKTHGDRTSFDGGYYACQRQDTARLETGSAYLSTRAEGEYRWTPIYSLQYLKAAGSGK